MKGTQCGQRLTMDRWIVMQDSLNQRDLMKKNQTQFLPEYEVTREEKEKRKGEKEEVGKSKYRGCRNHTCI